MLADALDVSTGWLTFVALVLVGAGLPSAVARLCRRLLPQERRHPTPLSPLAFGSSPKTRRSPRHAVALHRSLMASSFVVALCLVLLLFAAAIGDVGPQGIAVALVFVTPALLVILHGRRRGAGP